MTDLPAVLGGEPAFAPPLPFARPTLEERDRVLDLVAGALDSGWLTDGPLTRRLEEGVAATFGVDHCVAVASCTTGLLLLLQALEIDGPVLVPSFTFSATAHAVAWNGLPPRFADCDPVTWCLRPENVPEGVAAVVGVHVSGVPCDVPGLERRAAELGVPLVFDAAHAAGSLIDVGHGPRPLGGSGSAEVFSLTPTKVLSGAEGGLVTTNDPDLAARLRVARNYGNPGDYDTRFPGLNGRLSELHAAIALVALEHLEERVAHRNAVASRYRAALTAVPGVEFQGVGPGDRSSYKDLTILVDGDVFGCGRDTLVTALDAEGVATRRYYSPPVHRQRAYRGVATGPLPVTDDLAARVVSLPIWSHLPLETVDRVAAAIARIGRHGAAVERALR